MTIRTISIDFDGVLHQYTSPWLNAKTIYDPPVPGAIDFLRELITSFKWDVCIFSTRNTEPAGVKAMQKWLVENGLEEAWVTRIRFPLEKPLAWIGLDDRIITFEGFFPKEAELWNFKPWNKRDAGIAPQEHDAVSAQSDAARDQEEHRQGSTEAKQA